MYKRAVLYGGLLSAVLLLLSGLPKNIKAQEKPNLSEPFKRCWVYGDSNGLSRIVASDNESNIILTIDNYSLISINPATNLENWKSLSGGKLETEVISDESNLFFVTSFEKESKDRTFTLNSISLRTGITNWQKKLTDYPSAKLNRIKNRELLFLTTEDKFLTAVRKNNGEIVWTKIFPSPIISVEASNPEHLNILMADRLLRVRTNSGEAFDETKLKKNEISNSVITDSYLLLGYSTGEIAKITAEASKNDVLWKIKAGASISGLVMYQNEVLVTSLDNFIYLFSGESGKLRWKKRVAGRINIKPLIYSNFAIVVNSGDNAVSVVDLRDGKVVNQIQLEEDNYFSGPPLVSGIFMVVQTFKGAYFFVNTSVNCK